MHICMRNLKSLKAASKYYLNFLNIPNSLLPELMQLLVSNFELFCNLFLCNAVILRILNDVEIEAEFGR